jgi:hypothetical protein
MARSLVVTMDEAKEALLASESAESLEMMTVAPKEARRVFEWARCSLAVMGLSKEFLKEQ